MALLLLPQPCHPWQGAHREKAMLFPLSSSPSKTIRIKLGRGFSFLLSSLARIDQLLPMILCMMMVMAGLGSCFSVFMRLAINSSDESMGITMATISLLQTIVATCGSVVVVIFFHNTVLSLALLIMISAFIPMPTIPFLSLNMKD